MSVLQKAVELAQELVSSQEFKQYVEARDMIEQDERATELMSLYSQKEQLLQETMRDEPENDIKISQLNEQMDELRDEIIDNDELSSFAQAQTQFQYLMNQVNQIIGSYINPNAGCACGASDCGGCPGCH